MDEHWYVFYTETANRDLDDIYKHIAERLLEPVNAAKQVNKILDAIDSLDFMPFRYRLCDIEPWCQKGYRFMPVGNYNVYYMPKAVEEMKETDAYLSAVGTDAKGIVVISRIIYAGRDIEKALNETE